MKAGRGISEIDLQIRVARYLDRHPRTRGIWFHSPNGGERTKRGGGSLKAQGVKPGVPDVLCLRPTLDGSPGLAIELKTATGRLSDAQKGWKEKLQRLGWHVHVCRSVAEVVAAVNKAYSDTEVD